MHFVLTYDLSLKDEERRDAEERIDEVLSPYQHTRKLTTFFIIHVNSYSDWTLIRSNMSEIAQDLNGALHYIMSPLMSGGRYDGYLPQNDWNDINAITSLD